MPGHGRRPSSHRVLIKGESELQRDLDDRLLCRDEDMAEDKQLGAVLQLLPLFQAGGSMQVLMLA